MSKYTVYLRSKETGEERGVEMEGPWDDVAQYLWTDGNLGCDCNRQLQFDQAAGKRTPLGDTHCSDGRFLIVKVVLADGTELRDYE